MRIRKFDNIKCLGILLIVFGHMLEALECGYIGECLHITFAQDTFTKILSLKWIIK